MGIDPIVKISAGNINFEKL